MTDISNKGYCFVKFLKAGTILAPEFRKFSNAVLSRWVKVEATGYVGFPAPKSNKDDSYYIPVLHLQAPRHVSVFPSWILVLGPLDWNCYEAEKKKG